MITKNKILLTVLILPFLIFSQTKDKESFIDTTSIVFKAKLFTISNHGYKDKKTLINNIEKTPYSLYGNNEFLFIKIKASRYCYENEGIITFTWCDCDYYVCYSFKKDAYYLLGGFQIDNIKEFEKEYKGSIFSTSWGYKIDDKILTEFIIQMNLNKINKAKKCFVKCTETWE